jgi:osmotically-inducible protein OsmY
MKRWSMLLVGLSAFACASQSSSQNPAKQPVLTKVSEGNTQIEATYSEAAVREPTSADSEAKGIVTDDSRGAMEAESTSAGASMQPEESVTRITAPLPEPEHEREAPYKAMQDVGDRTAKQRALKPSGLTLAEQKEHQEDLRVTRQIRHAVAGDRALSVAAKNVRIVTSNGKVTLRGPVKNQLEREKIDAAARRLAGSSNVNNQLDVKR